LSDEDDDEDYELQEYNERELQYSRLDDIDEVIYLRDLFGSNP
jgi:hypothetical protein